MLVGMKCLKTRGREGRVVGIVVDPGRRDDEKKKKKQEGGERRRRVQKRRKRVRTCSRMYTGVSKMKTRMERTVRSEVCKKRVEDAAGWKKIGAIRRESQRGTRRRPIGRMEVGETTSLFLLLTVVTA